MNQKILLLLSIFIISAYAQSGRIAGGNVANPGQFRYHVKLEPSSGSFRRLCGGALIRYNWVVTIAQCIFNARDVIVRLGVVDRLVGPEGAIFWVRDRNHIIVHEEFDGDIWTGDFKNDIGLIFLEEATEDLLYITDSNGVLLINTIAFPSNNDLDIENLPGVVTGFGFYEDGDTALQSMKLRYGVMDILPQATCVSLNPRITDGHFCTDTSAGISTCVGDEGGPFVTSIEGHATVIGLASTAFDECTEGHPAVFVNLVSFFDWVMSRLDNIPIVPTVDPPTSTAPPDNGNNNCKCDCHCHTCPPQIPSPIENEPKTNNFWK